MTTDKNRPAIQIGQRPSRGMGENPEPSNAPTSKLRVNRATTHPLAAVRDTSEPREPHAHDVERQVEQDDPPAAFPTLPPGMRPLLFTAEQAAALLAVRASWLRRTAAEGAIACTFVGKHLRFSDADLAAIITHGARGPRPEHDAEPTAQPGGPHPKA